MRIPFTPGLPFPAHFSFMLSNVPCRNITSNAIAIRGTTSSWCVPIFFADFFSTNILFRSSSFLFSFLSFPLPY